jgi:hypothetical protein
VGDCFRRGQRRRPVSGSLDEGVSRPRLAAGLASCDDVPEAVRELTDGRGTDSVIDAVGMEAHGTKSAGLAQKAVDLLPDAVATAVMKRTGVDRLQL